MKEGKITRDAIDVFFAKTLAADSGLELFGVLHISITLATLAVYVLLFVFREKLRIFGRFQTIRFFMAAVLLGNMAVHYLSRIFTRQWDFGEDLPLHLCFVANFFLIYILFTNNEGGIYKVVYYFTLIGPLPAMFFPDLHRNYTGWVFYQFIISHHFMLMCSLYCLFVLGYTTTLKSAAAAFFIGNAYMLAIAAFNNVFNTDYLMTTGLPDRLYVALPFLNSLPAAVWLEFAGIITLLLASFGRRLSYDQ